MYIVMETEHLMLRRFTDADIEHLFGLNSDPEVMRYLTGGKATPWEKIQDEIIPAHIAMYEQFRVSCPPQTGTRCRLSQQAKVSGAR